MKTKKTTILFLLLLISIHLLAADSTQYKSKYKFGVDVLLNPTYAVSNIVKSKDFSIANFDNTYLVGIKLRRRNEQLRSSIGINTYSNIIAAVNGSPKITTNYKVLNFRLGFEHRIKFNSKWQCGIGLDWVRNANDSTKKFISSSDSISIVTTDRSWGFGPVVNLQYNFTSFLSIAVESYGYLNWYNLDNHTTYKLSPELNSVEKSRGNKFRFTPPVLFFIILKF